MTRLPTPIGPVEADDPGRTAMLRQCATQVDAAHQGIHGVQQQLAHRLDRLRVGWHEPAAVAFFRGYCRVDTGIEELKQSLDDLHAHLTPPRAHS